jgi:putative oxidoreductase
MSEQISGRFHHIGLLILRIGIGAIYMYVHGMPKIMGGPERWEQYGSAMQHVGIEAFPVVWGFGAAFAEFFGGLASTLGLFFFPAAGLLFVTMAIATIMHLATGDGLGGSAHAMKMGVLFSSLLLIGPGKYSLDSMLRSKRRKLYR